MNCVKDIFNEFHKVQNQIEMPLEDMKKELLMTLAKGSCRNITREEVHQLIDEIYEEYAG